MQNDKNNIIRAVVFFLLSAILTGIFISQTSWLMYDSTRQMLLSGSIAGGKWLVQIAAALLFVKDKKWAFIRRIGYVCLTGSIALFVFYILRFLPLPLSNFSLFVLSIIISVLVMIAKYYTAVQKTGLPAKWYLLWLLCLAIAIFLQIKVVF